MSISTSSTIMHEMRVYAKKVGLKPSFCCYKRWGLKKKGGQGHKPVIPLRFSKNRCAGNRACLCHPFCGQQAIARLKEQKNEAATANERSPVE